MDGHEGMNLVKIQIRISLNEIDLSNQKSDNCEAGVEFMKMQILALQIWTKLEC